MDSLWEGLSQQSFSGPDLISLSRKPTFQAEFLSAPDLSERPQLSLRRAKRFFCDHLRVFSECATAHPLVPGVGLRKPTFMEGHDQAQSLLGSVSPFARIAQSSKAHSTP